MDIKWRQKKQNEIKAIWQALKKAKQSKKIKNFTVCVLIDKRTYKTNESREYWRKGEEEKRREEGENRGDNLNGQGRRMRGRETVEGRWNGIQ